MLFGTLSLAFSCCFAGVSATLLGYAWTNAYVQKRRKKQMLTYLHADKKHYVNTFLKCDGFAALLIGFIKNQPQKRIGDKHKHILFEHTLKRASRAYEKQSDQAGLTFFISSYSYGVARIKLSGVFLLCGAFLGSIFSTALLFLMGCMGLFFGWMSVPWAFRQEIKARKHGIEKQLSEMMEVVSLGLRSGMSFDKSLEMYHSHFSTGLGAELAAAQQQWTVGLVTREAALRALARSYDSSLFGRVVENIVRSLRFGASLADSLEASAAESRSIHKSKVEERVAKAPVKMLIPTGTLILPAMLLLVLGPVLLGLIQDI